MYYIILSFIILLCSVVIVKVSKNKFKQMQKIDIEPVVKQKQAEVKKRLIESRLQKKFLNLGQGFLDIFKEIRNGLQKFTKQTKRKIDRSLNLQSGWKLRRAKRRQVEDEAVLAAKLLEAQILLKKKKIDEAEDKFIKVLEIDPKNIETYMALGQIYTMREDWETAEEAYRYIIKIKPKFLEGYKRLADIFKMLRKWDDLKKLMEEVLSSGYEEAWVYGLLGLAHKKTGYADKALEYFRRAVEIEPKNEELLDSLLEVAIINKNKTLAQKAWNTLTGISKDEIKLQSYRNKIDIL
jgi:tetratricopeptide (TPR) repeat protein